ncbi:MAG: 16S rRNA (adenine(1518)-N(6)/adenine(1519)-N(6))-dimethyltransferase RsmA [Polyangiales bacterium]
MTDPLGGVPDARDLLRRYDLRPKRSFSQNFLIQPGAIRQIADATAAIGPRIVELGAGLGALTYALLERGCEVTAVELDRDMVAVLSREYGNHPRLAIVQADAAKFDFRDHVGPDGGDLTIAGNLPYQATGAILRQIMQHRDVVRGAVLMVQREVRDRLTASPATKDYGALTVFTQAGFEVDTLCRLRPGSFYPPPKVESAVICLTPRQTPLADETEDFQAVVRAAFHTRRKTLRNALRQLGSPAHADATLEASEIDPQRRGESLSIAEFARLAAAWARTQPSRDGE